jgi:hypothetical protein
MIEFDSRIWKLKDFDKKALLQFQNDFIYRLIKKYLPYFKVEYLLRKLYTVQSSNFRTEIISKHSRTTCLPIYVAPFKVVTTGLYIVSSATVPQFEAFPEVDYLKLSKCI